MNNHKYPYMVDIFKGEGRLLFIPYFSHIYGGRIQSEERFTMEENDNYVFIGEYAEKAINIIKESALANKTFSSEEKTALWQKNSKYKSWTSFCNNNHLVVMSYFEDGHYKIDSMLHSKVYKVAYIDCIKSFELPPNATQEEIGKTIYDALNLSEEVDNGVKKGKKEKKIKLLNGQELHIVEPIDSHFVDCGDSSTAEIYQCYNYVKNDAEVSIADIFLGIAVELDCDITVDNIHKMWGQLYGKADFFEIKNKDQGIFNLWVELKNKSVHKVSYFKKMSDDLLLECSLELQQPNKRKKLDEKITKEFEEFAVSCRIE